MNLSQYVKKRNGVPFGHPASLRNNLERSLGAKNFDSFWNYWNPIFGYYLGLRIFKPLKNLLPMAISLVFTFIFCGLIHDAVTSVVRGKISFFFSVWFLLMSVFVLISKRMNYNFSQQKWIVRAAANLSIIVLCFFLTQLLNSKFGFY